MPEFIVLYNGKKTYPKESFLNLSDSFIDKKNLPANTAELVVKVLNIRYKENQELLRKSKALHDYSFFIDLAQEYLEKGSQLKDAIHKAALECEKRGVMQPFLKEHISEVENMLNVEWNWEDALEVGMEEAREEGLKEGLQEGQKKGREEERQKVIQSLSEFFPAEQIAKMLKIPVEEVSFSLES